jgi:hypothetical protein
MKNKQRKANSFYIIFGFPFSTYIGVALTIVMATKSDCLLGVVPN